jgi:ubiquinone biosynthesis protein UbiJ
VSSNPAIAAINHVLRQQEWPQALLAPHAGRAVTVRLAPFPDLRLRIRDDGLLQAASEEAAAELTVTLKPGVLPRILQRDEAALRDIELSGAADLAQLAQRLFRDLAWDAEEDLSRLFGDVLAHRMARAGREFLAWQQDAARRLAQNLAEYWTEEQPLLARHDEADAFAADVARTRDAVDALERRIDALPKRPAR